MVNEAQIPIYGVFKSRTVDSSLVDDFAVIGGYHTVNTIQERDSIPDSVKRAGMGVYVISENKLYILQQNQITWEEQVSGDNASITATTSEIPVSTLIPNTIVLANPNHSDEFENYIAVYVVAIDGENVKLSYFGTVIPENMPESVKFGDKIFINETGILSTEMPDCGKCKHIGNVIITNDNKLAILLSNIQIDYTTIA